MYDTRTNLYYTIDHLWVRPGQRTVQVGLTDFASEALGDILFVTMPTNGSAVCRFESFAAVETTKSIVDLLAPVNGAVVACNEAVVQTPHLLNDDPYGHGWMCEVEIYNLIELSDLLKPEEYEQLIENTD